jgi:hypothetical protein
MRQLGYLLITVGFLAGSYFTVVEREGVPVVLYLTSFAVGVLGVALARIAIHRATRSAHVIEANIAAIASSLERVVSRVEALARDKASIDVYELRHHIDRELPEHLDAFVQARQSLAHTYGLAAYADVMNPFSAGERYLNRVWSTSTDGYVDEAHTYLDLAREQFAETLEVFRRLGERR